MSWGKRGQPPGAVLDGGLSGSWSPSKGQRAINALTSLITRSLIPVSVFYQLIPTGSQSAGKPRRCPSQRSVTSTEDTRWINEGRRITSTEYDAPARQNAAQLFVLTWEKRLLHAAKRKTSSCRIVMYVYVWPHTGGDRQGRQQY